MKNIFAACFSTKKIQWHDEGAVSERSVTYHRHTHLNASYLLFGTLCHNTVDICIDTIDFIEDDILQKILYLSFPENQKKSLKNKSFKNASH